MVSNLLVRIDLSRKDFSKGQRKIADYIAEHYDTTAFLTASCLGELVGVSESTVVRFASQLGYDGYPQLQKAMQELILDQLRFSDRIEITAARAGDNVMQSVLEQDILKLRRTADHISREDFFCVVDSIISAENIYLFGDATASYLAGYFGHYLDLFLGNIRLLDTFSTDTVYEKMPRISERDVLFVISVSRCSDTAAEAVRFAKERGAHVIAVTDSMNPSVASKADSVLLARCDSISVYEDLTAPLCLINALLTAVIVRRKDAITDALSVLDREDHFAESAEKETAYE